MIYYIRFFGGSLDGKIRVFPDHFPIPDLYHYMPTQEIYEYVPFRHCYVLQHPPFKEDH